MTNVDFAAAQKRVAARRHERNTATAARAIRHRADAAHTRLPSLLRGPAATALSYWDAIRGRGGTQPAFRVGQVDAELLDEELLELLGGQVGEALKYHGAHLREDWRAEIEAALRAVLFKLTIWDHDASYGASLQNLRYSRAGGAPPARWQKALHGLVSVAGRYAWTKWEERQLELDSDEGALLLLRRLSGVAAAAYRLAAFASFLVFLANGRYRTLLDRALRLRLRPTTSALAHEVSFEYLNRQLVWHAFTEFLLFLLPLVGVARWRRLLARAWRGLAALFSSTSSRADAPAPRGELAFLPERTCAICYQDQNPSPAEADAGGGAGGVGIAGSAGTDVTSAYEAVPCGCVYDYACLAARLDAADGAAWACLRCGAGVEAARPWGGDVVPARDAGSRPGSGKSVSFADEPDESFVKLDPMPDVDEREREAGGEEWGARDDDDDGDEEEEDAGNVDPASSLVARALHAEEADA